MAIKKPNSNHFYRLKLLFSPVELQIYTLRHLAMIAVKLPVTGAETKQQWGQIRVTNKFQVALGEK